MMVMSATKYLWAKTTSVAELYIAVNGLWKTIESFLHPTIQPAGRVQEMFRQLPNIFSQDNGKADPDHMADVLLITEQKQEEDIRDFAYEDKSPIHNNCQCNGGYKVDLLRLKDQNHRHWDLFMLGC